MATVMVVDDSHVMRRVIVSFLEDHTPHDVVAEAENGEDAYRKYRYYEPDLVTMDITMPVLDGIQATKKIIKEFPDAKIIMVSAVSQKDRVVEAIKSGAKNFILKPVSAEKVISIVQRVLTENANGNSGPV